MLLGLAPNTLDAYARGLDDFLGFCQKANISPVTATRADLARYVGDLRERQDGRHSPSEVLRGVLGRTYAEEVLSRVLHATQFTRHLDRHGYIRFKHWRLFGENGLAGEDVSVWVYEETLKIEYRATTLALYSLTFQRRSKQIAEVKNPRRIQTFFRSPQLDLWQLSDTEWLLALRRPEPVARKKQGQIVPLARQHLLPEFGATG